MNCVFPTNKKGAACSNDCGYKLRRDYDEPPHRNCKGTPRDHTTCQHWTGRKVGSEHCKTCNGSVKVFVFECEKLGRCTVKKRIDGAACCEGCGEYEKKD